MDRLYTILDTLTARRHGWEPLDLARAYLDGGARWIQLRAKTGSAREMLDLAEALVRLAQPCGAVVIVNDRADVAALAGAAGAHVGQDDLPVPAVRRVLGSAIVGLSTHTDAQIAQAARTDASYVAVGPVFETGSKETGYRAVGLDFVRRASKAAGRPVVAIGGITLARAPEVIAAGAAAVAVIGDLIAAGDPRARVGAYLSVLRV